MNAKIQQIRIEDYNYPLPDGQIAKFPLAQRDTSKLLLNKNGELSEHSFSDLPSLLPENSLLVFNNTKVIQARLFFYKETGAQIEIFCLEPYLPADYALSFQQTRTCEWKCLIGNAKKWKEGKLSAQIGTTTLTAEQTGNDGESYMVRFEWNNERMTFADILDAAGELPIPPYLHRRTEASDLETYQTTYSKIKGSVAAPTAGLHFTPAVFDALLERGIGNAELTLHVGAGTFRPVKTETIGDHTMHAETFSVSRRVLALLIYNLGRITAVGTTSVRTLESLYWIGVQLENNPDQSIFQVSQWEPYETTRQIPVEKSLQNIIDYLAKNGKENLQASTQIMIVPGYEFKLVDSIITNFHQPQSTLLLLVSAYLKSDWRTMYDYALAHDFRFLSYGDSSLLINETNRSL